MNEDGLKLFKVRYARQIVEYYLYYIGAHDSIEAEQTLTKLVKEHTESGTDLQIEALVDRKIEQELYEAKECEENEQREPDITCWEVQ